MPFIKVRCFAALLLFISIIGGLPVKASPLTGPVLYQPGMNSVTDSLAPGGDSSHTDAFMEDLLKQYPQYFDSILANRKTWHVQVIYTQVDRGANGIAALKNHYFNVNPAQYFYPSTGIQLPLALLTLQRLGELKATGIDKNTTMLTEAAQPKQTAVYNDPTTPNGKPSIGHYLKKMLLTNDADAGNRLYEFLGQEYINEQLLQKGYPGAQVIQRLETALTPEQNRHTNPIRFLAPVNKLLYQQAPRYNSKPHLQRKDSLVWPPLDFSGNNQITLEDLHTLLISLVFPNKVTSSQRFAVTDDDRKFILQYMSQLPAESIYPPYQDDTAKYYPAYSKYLLYGAEKGDLPANIRIFNKSGNGYGHLLDVAYMVDFDRKIEFFLSAVIYCNKDGVLNEGAYDYKTNGFPFMKNLGQVMYEYETKREKKIEPDLNELRFEYDGR
jgi:hypothetical protein